MSETRRFLTESALTTCLARLDVFQRATHPVYHRLAHVRYNVRWDGGVAESDYTLAPTVDSGRLAPDGELVALCGLGGGL